jgi:hypothetical protein
LASKAVALSLETPSDTTVMPKWTMSASPRRTSVEVLEKVWGQLVVTIEKQRELAGGLGDTIFRTMAVPLFCSW